MKRARCLFSCLLLAASGCGHGNHGPGTPTDAGVQDASAAVADGAQTQDASTADAAEGDAGSPCITSGTELCEGFESGAINPAIWGKHLSANASLKVDSVHVHSGKYALHATVTPGDQNMAQITDAVTFPAANGTFYTRAFVYFDPDLPANDMGGFHMGFLVASGNNDLGLVEAGLGSAGNKRYLGYSIYFGGGPNSTNQGPTFTEFGPESPTHIVPQTWICLELMESTDATSASRRVWVNDTELTEQQSTYSGRPPPKLDVMAIGVWQYHVSPTLSDVWYDDIRVSKSRIGCSD